jgi:hypothetical protein
MRIPALQCWRQICRCLRQQLRHYLEKFPARQLNDRSRGRSHVTPKAFGVLRGYPAWIRTKNNASKGRCVTVTPRGTRICGLDSRISPPAQFPKCNLGNGLSVRSGGRRPGHHALSNANTEQLAAKIKVESQRAQPQRVCDVSNKPGYGAHDFPQELSPSSQI